MKRPNALLNTLILVLVLLGVPAQGREVKVERGEIDGAPYRIQIPSKWNRGLVMYAHGYLSRGRTWFPLNDALCAVFLERGYALAESGYSRQGWAVEEAVRESEALRCHFVKQHGKTDAVFITGHSMGGLISLAVIEQHPESYDGALTLCGPLVPALQFFKDPVFDMLVTFEALFGSSLPEGPRPVIESPVLTARAIEDALESDPEAAGRFARHWGIRREDLSGIIAFYHALYRELVDRAGGNPIDNRNTVYTGFDLIRESGAPVPRYAAGQKALAYLRRYYTPTGALEDPVLAVHTIYDPGVPPRLVNPYDVTLSLQGREKWFVHRYVEAEGHCNIAPDLVGKAFDDLRKWAAGGVRPDAGVLR
jgi:pimeloyl-ACP methyl ester carboxylesterase